MIIPSLLLLAGGLVGCNKDDELVLAQFNGDDDILVVCVGEGEDCEPVSAIDVHSTNGSTLIGTASVDPATGPVGTLHTVSVDVDDAWEDQVLLVAAEFIGIRGQQTWELRQDSADHGNWILEVESLGNDDEVREEEILLRLYEDQDEPDLVTTTEPEES